MRASGDSGRGKMKQTPRFCQGPTHFPVVAGTSISAWSEVNVGEKCERRED
jgi:hypothetical protein